MQDAVILNGLLFSSWSSGLFWRACFFDAQADATLTVNFQYLNRNILAHLQTVDYTEVEELLRFAAGGDKN